MNVNLSELINTVIIPILQIAFPISLTFAIVERIVNIVISFVRGDKYVKM
jgi:hypothetical protein